MIAAVVSFVCWGCKDEDRLIAGYVPLAPSGIPYRNYDYMFNGILKHLTGLSNDSVWGVVVTEIQSDASARCSAQFDLDGSGPLTEIKCNGVKLLQHTSSYNGQYLTLVNGLQYLAVVRGDTSNTKSADFFAHHSAAWKLTLPSGEIATDTVPFPLAFSSIGTPIVRDSLYDTLSVHKEIHLTWNGTSPNTQVQITLYWYPTTKSDFSYVPVTYYFPDSGRCIISADSVIAAGLPTSGALLIHCTRANYKHTATFENGTKRLGNLAVATAYGYAYLRP